jgi:hypothetical protein
MRGPTEISIDAARRLESLGIPYLIGGSMASSAYGVPRTTADVDLVIELSADQIDGLARALENDFYVSRDAMFEAVRDRRSFKALHLETGFMLDFFVRGDARFDRMEFDRRVPLRVRDDGLALFFKMAEDTVLRKLQWYRSGGEVSDQQWKDIVGVLEVCSDELDRAYMERWARELGVRDLLARARQEATDG